jgi:hypothetical protein
MSVFQHEQSRKELSRTPSTFTIASQRTQPWAMGIHGVRAWHPWNFGMGKYPHIAWAKLIPTKKKSQSELAKRCRSERPKFSGVQSAYFRWTRSVCASPEEWTSPASAGSIYFEAVCIQLVTSQSNYCWVGSGQWRKRVVHFTYLQIA